MIKIIHIYFMKKNSVARANEDNQLIIEKFTENFNHLNVKAGKL